MIRESIADLVEGREISGETAYETFMEIMSGETSDAQIATFITALRMRGETPEVIAGCARAMREKMTTVKTGAEVVVDVVGTGGDGANTFNISTAAAIVAAACGITVAKHGNYGVSSQCGSADVLREAGVNIDISPTQMSECLERVGLAFLFAPSLHPAMKYAVGPRREVGIRTVFNILGPLCNPANARYGLLGVYSAELVPVMAAAALELGAKHLFVVHGNDGLDEITTTTTTLINEIKDGRIQSYEFDPRVLGIELCKPGDLVGGTPDENTTTLYSILDLEVGPRHDIVCLNAAVAIVAADAADSLKEGFEMAHNAIESERARTKLHNLVNVTNS